jgi:hypothetical protein
MHADDADETQMKNRPLVQRATERSTLHLAQFVGLVPRVVHFRTSEACLRPGPAEKSLRRGFFQFLPRQSDAFRLVPELLQGVEFPHFFVENVNHDISIIE